MHSHSPAAAAPPLRPSALVIVIALAALMGIQPITTDLYLPALPALAAALNSPMVSTQMTLSALLFAFGGSQLLLGPAADRFGRRPVLLWGLGAYIVGSAGGALAGSIQALVGWRALQGVGMGAAVVCARAMVRDLFVPADGAKVMAKALSGLGLIAMASPLLGGVIASAFGWRATLAATGIFAAGCLALVAFALPETVPRRNPQALRLSAMVRTWVQVLRHPTFRAWALLITCTYGGIFTFLAASSFVFINVLGTSRLEYSLHLAGCSAFYVIGTVWCRHLLRHHGLAGAVRRGAWCTLAGSGAMVLLAWAGVFSPWALSLPMYVFALGHGVNQPCGQAAVVGPFPHHAGAASALAGFLLAAGAVALGAWLGLTMNGTVYPLVLTVGAMSALTVLVAWTLVQRHGELRA